MPLQTTGPISANDINLELNRAGTAPFSMNGADERGLAGVASGQISFDDFYGKASSTVTLDGMGNYYAEDWDDPGRAYVDICFYGNGDAEVIYDDGFGVYDYLINPPWFSPLTAGIGSSYQLRLTRLSGSNPNWFLNFSMNTWTTLNATRGFGYRRTTAGYTGGNLRLQIRELASGLVVATRDFSMAAEIAD